MGYVWASAIDVRLLANSQSARGSNAATTKHPPTAAGASGGFFFLLIEVSYW
jgi:hypothetical protein